LALAWSLQDVDSNQWVVAGVVVEEEEEGNLERAFAIVSRFKCLSVLWQ